MSHTFSLIATRDFASSLKNMGPEMENLHHSIMAKCNDLWKCARRPKSSEIIIRILGSQLSWPSVTRWNSLFKAVKCIIQHENKLKDLIEALDLSIAFEESDINYLKEVSSVSQPIAIAIDFMQKDDCYYGQILPVLFAIRT